MKLSSTNTKATVALAVASVGCATQALPPRHSDSPDWGIVARGAPDTSTENHHVRLEDKDKNEKEDVLARPHGERRAKAALERLTPLGAVSEVTDAERMSGAEPTAIMVRLDDSVLFEGETAELMPAARERLDRVAEALHEVRAESIVVRGFMDRSGDARRDLEVSRRRAAAVRLFFISRGVHASRVRSEGLGSTELVSSNASADGRSANRRVEVIVTSPAADDAKR